MSQTSAPDPLWKGIPPWLVSIILLIGTPAVLVTFAQTLTHNPILTILIGLAYYIVMALLGFVGKIWKRLEDPLVNRIVQWIITRTQEFTSHYYQYYCEHLVYEHQVLDVKGLGTRAVHDLELEQVFVDLRINALPAHQASSDPLHAEVPRHSQQVSEQLQETHSIWDYLAGRVTANRHLVILGAPGSGKTTLLRHLTLILAQPQTYSQQQLKRHTFPILLFIRDHAKSIVEQPNFSLAIAVEEHMQQKWQKSIPAFWIDHQLERGICLVLLDGLDEVADATTRKKVVEWVQTQTTRYHQNRFVLTSRPYGYLENPLNGVTVLDVQPFTSNQVELFIQNWYLANELKSWGKDDPGVLLRALEGKRDLLQRLRQAPALLALTVNPLLLTMIATVHRFRSSLPGRRVELYAEICEVFLGKRYQAREIPQDLSPAQKQQVLQSLAYFMMQNGIREISSSEAEREITPALALVNSQITPADFLNVTKNADGLLIERNPGIYGFAHKTFQEYLTAVHIKEEGLESVLLGKVANDWWHETIRLYCAQTDATRLIQACLNNQPLIASTLVLAFECDDEKLKIQPVAQEQLNHILEAGGEDSDEERRHIIANALITRRTRQMVHIHDETYIDTSLVTCEEYQLFLDEQRVQCKYYQPDHWLSFSFPKGIGKSPILGIRHSDAQTFCDWLSLRDREQWHYRFPQAKEHPSQDIHGRKKISVEHGYWISEEPLFLWSSGKPLESFHLQIVDFINTAFARDRTLPDFLHARDLDRARDRALDHALDHPLSLSLDHVRDSVLDFDSVRNYGIDVKKEFALTLDRAFSRDQGHDRTLALYRARTLCLGLVQNLALSRERESEVRFGNILADKITLILSNVYDLYLVLLLLQKRIEGEFPAYEGILLVKERKQNQNTQ